MSAHQTEKHQATKAAKFLISIIKACSFLPMKVLSERLHQRNDLCKKLLLLQDAHHSVLSVQSHPAAVCSVRGAWTRLFSYWQMLSLARHIRN